MSLCPNRRTRSSRIAPFVVYDAVLLNDSSSMLSVLSVAKAEAQPVPHTIRDSGRPACA